jgi:hypothetical protein
VLLAVEWLIPGLDVGLRPVGAVSVLADCRLLCMAAFEA